MVQFYNDHVDFKVWAPERSGMQLHLPDIGSSCIDMKKNAEGYFSIEVPGVKDGSLYYFRPDNGKDFPDPASQFQPEGVHGPSSVVNHNSFEWHDNNWICPHINDLVIYELHVGTFTNQGTFDAVIPKLDHLIDVGINAIELMPVNQFPGSRNWGYDGVFLYAVQNSYGGPKGLKHLVNACHQKGIAVILDVVYNHLGPEGNYLDNYGPYFTDQYKTPWGRALNFDGPYSDGVREFFSNNPIYWFTNYHIDGIRADAIHTIFDNGAVHFWELVHDKVEDFKSKTRKNVLLIAESDYNSPRVINAPASGGYGFDAQWLDDFHHALYVLLDKKGKERYYDFGSIEQMAKAYKEGFVHSGEYVRFRKRKHGRSSTGIPGNKFIVFNQNHDQIGNRVKGERLCMLVDIERQKLAAAATILSPYIPMLFMGEEFAAETPFYYFVSHSDEKLIQAVREGRKKEFEGLQWTTEPPDPQAEETFLQSKIQWNSRNEGSHGIILQWHKELISLRKTLLALNNFNKANIDVKIISNECLLLYRESHDRSQKLICILNFAEDQIKSTIPLNGLMFRKLLDSKDKQWMENKTSEKDLPAQLINDLQLNIPSCAVAVYVSE